jgi:outer membrane lipoprotein SlyB
MNALPLACSLLVILGMNGQALADPPPHARYGQSKPDTGYTGYSGQNWSQDYGIRDGQCNREAIGAVVGGGVGAVLGNQIGKGDERSVATVVGAVAGAVIGAEIGRDLDREDRACMGHALELAPPGSRVIWTDRGGIEFVVYPGEFDTRRGPGCRWVRVEVEKSKKGGKKHKTKQKKLLACPGNRGEWRFL